METEKNTRRKKTSWKEEKKNRVEILKKQKATSTVGTEKHAVGRW